MLPNQVHFLYDAILVNENTLDNSANSIYEIQMQHQPAILRISKYSRQKERHVNFELAWMHELARHMPQIAGPIPSRNNRLFEVIDTDTTWIACVFHKASGHMIDPANPQEWNGALFHKLGQLMGNLHTYTKPYVGKIGIDEQLDWRHSYMFWPENNQWVDPDILPIWNQTLAEMERLSTTEADYGIVHTDIHHQNFHVADGNIVLFDFDDCAYSWYAYDIASTLFFVAGTADCRKAGNGKETLGRFGELFCAVIGKMRNYRRTG